MNREHGEFPEANSRQWHGRARQRLGDARPRFEPDRAQWLRLIERPANGRWPRPGRPLPRRCAEPARPEWTRAVFAETKTVKNRVHLDIDVAPGVAFGSEERKAAAWARSEQLTAQGATLLRELDEPARWWLVMTDPEGNEFCLG